MGTRDWTTLVKALAGPEAGEAGRARTSTRVRATQVLGEAGIPMGPVLGGATDDAHAGPALGRFVLGPELGRGGMGRINEARDPELLRTVAIKRLLDPTKVDDASLARFVAEAQITAQLDHPNIVPIHELGLTEDGQLFLVMKRVSGWSLRQILDAQRAGDAEANEIWVPFRLLMLYILVCGAVGYAHAHQVLHRDLKPDNLMLGPFGEAYVMDWGVARLIGAEDEPIERQRLANDGTAPPRQAAGPDAPALAPAETGSPVVTGASGSLAHLSLHRTLDGTSIGTPGYMSPEQIEGRLGELDARSDVWSLGAILYEILTLQPAYDGDNVYQVLFRAVSGPPVDPRERAPQRAIDDEIAELCMAALRTDRDARLASALELGQGIGRYLDQRRAAAPDGDRCDG